MISHFEEFELLPDFQSAYRCDYATEMAVLNVYTDLIDAILDLTTAFNTIDHNILLHRLEITFGFHGVPLQWMR